MMNKIKHITSAPYHPSSNGAAENVVKWFKVGLNKALLDAKNVNVSVETLISRYLFANRVTPHCYTGDAPSKLMLNRSLKTRFDILKDTNSEENADRQIRNYSEKRNVDFCLRELVWVVDYRNPSKPKWVRAEVVMRLGSRNFICSVVKENLK